MSHAKEERKALVTHLFRMHGNFATRPGGDYTTELLRLMHESFHEDDYMCPPHSHSPNEEHSIDNFTLTFGDNYSEDILDLLRGKSE